MLENRKKLGKIAKMKRLEQDLTLEALSDENISPATISQIERGNEKVSKKKVLHLCELLDIPLEEERVNEDEHILLHEQILLSKLKKIENTIDLVDAKKGLKQLNVILKEPAHKLSNKVKAFIHYLKGRAYMLKGKHKANQRRIISAEKNLTKSIKITAKNPELNSTNIQVLAYHELGRLFYYKNQFNDALISVEKGISKFVPNGSRQYVKPILEVSKAIYLEKLDMLHDALKVLENMWGEIDSINNIQVILNMFETRAIVLKKLERYEEAIPFCDQGIELARINEVYERSFDLWTVRGSIYSGIGDLNEAEDSLLAALDLEELVTKQYLFVSTYTELGRLKLKKKLFSEAIDYLKKAITLGEETNDTRRLSQALLSLGDCYYYKKEIDIAFPFYKKAYKISKEHKFTRLLREILVQLVQCSKELNDPLYSDYVDMLVEIEVELKLRHDLI